MIDQVARDRGGSPDRFGYEWGAYSEIRPEYEEQFRRWTVHLAPAEWRGKSFLDVGCGMGRNSFWPMTYGAREGCAVDVDERSLASARRNLTAIGGPNAWMDIYGLVSTAKLRFFSAGMWEQLGDHVHSHQRLQHRHGQRVRLSSAGSWCRCVKQGVAKRCLGDKAARKRGRAATLENCRMSGIALCSKATTQKCQRKCHL